jgi:hypothetical protein
MLLVGLSACILLNELVGKRCPVIRWFNLLAAVGEWRRGVAAWVNGKGGGGVGWPPGGCGLRRGWRAVAICRVQRGSPQASSAPAAAMLRLRLPAAKLHAPDLAPSRWPRSFLPKQPPHAADGGRDRGGVPPLAAWERREERIRRNGPTCQHGQMEEMAEVGDSGSHGKKFSIDGS